MTFNCMYNQQTTHVKVQLCMYVLCCTYICHRFVVSTHNDSVFLTSLKAVILVIMPSSSVTN